MVRRVAFALLVVVTVVLLDVLLAEILAVDGFGIVDTLMVCAFSIKAIWVAIFFWHAVIGFFLLHGTSDPLGRVFPAAQRIRADDPILHRTAIIMTVRNEEPVDVFARLKAMMNAIEATGLGEHFDYFVLSDSSHPEVVATEERLAAALRFDADRKCRVIYRRRAMNVGSKHGNLRDFCERWGKDYEFMLILDADSLMTADAILRLVRIMQADPQIGVLQHLIVGILGSSFFARVFEFGHRHGMRCSMVGAVWWQGDRGQYRGHNALLRIAPFTELCHLEVSAPHPAAEAFSATTRLKAYCCIAPATKSGNCRKRVAAMRGCHPRCWISPGAITAGSMAISRI